MKKYYFTGLLLFLTAIIGFHFYAASQAEQQIHSVIQAETEKQDYISVQYSDVHIPAFGSSVSIKDLTVILGDHIERAQHLTLDVNYFDLLNIYIGGMEYGLNNLNEAIIEIGKPSYVNKSGLEEIKLDKLTISYIGNVMDGIISAINGTPFSHGHSIEAKSSGLVTQLPGTTLSKLTARGFRYSGSVSAGQTNFWIDGTHQFKMDSLTWTPSENFQNTYSFFIKGFGYPVDAVPFQSASLHTQPDEQNKLKIEAAVRSELALFSSSGFIHPKNPFGDSKLRDAEISISKFSDSFRQVLFNVERLLSISLPQSENGITFHLEGTLANPRIADN